MAVYHLPQPPATNTVWIVLDGQVEEWIRDRDIEDDPARPVYRGEDGASLRWLDLFDRGNGEVHDERPPTRGEALDRLQDEIENGRLHSVLDLFVQHLAEWGADGLDVKATAERVLDRLADA